MKRLLFLLAVTVIIGQSCLKNDDCNDCFSGPALFGFTLMPTELLANKDTASLIPSVYKLDTIRLYYFDGDIKKNVALGYGRINEKGDYLVSTDISVVSASKNINTFYLYLNQEDTDTIYFACKLVNDGCCTSYSYDSLSYNGKKMLYYKNSSLRYAVKPQPNIR